MPAPAGQTRDKASHGEVFYVSFLHTSDATDNDRFIGTCALRIEGGKLTITGRRYPSVRHRRRISHGYRLTDMLVASIVGIALYPLACTYVYLANHLLTTQATLEIDLVQLCDVSCDWDWAYFNVRGASGEITTQFIVNTGSRDASVKLVSRLTALP